MSFKFCVLVSLSLPSVNVVITKVLISFHYLNLSSLGDLGQSANLRGLCRCPNSCKVGCLGHVTAEYPVLLSQLRSTQSRARC